MESNIPMKRGQQTPPGRGTAILKGAAAVLALQGDHASMSDIATAAGVGRATLYRYFPSRARLLSELRRISMGSVNARLMAARIGEVAVDEGIARTVRALIEVGDSVVLLAREQRGSAPLRFERRLNQPVRELLERGQANGEIRDDIASGVLLRALTGLIVDVLTTIPRPSIEDMTAMITSLFLDGTRAQKRTRA